MYEQLTLADLFRHSQPPKPQNAPLRFNGFSSIAEYERECHRHGYKTKRIPYQKDGEVFLLLVTSPPKTGTSIETWDLFTADETREVLDGVINGITSNYTGKLTAHGYFPVD